MRLVILVLIVLMTCSCNKKSKEIEDYLYPSNVNLECIAKEPLLDSPVAIEFDNQGRIWVLEMRSYMSNIEGQNEQAPISRIKILEDMDKDGLMDTSRIFLDSLILPRSLLLAYGGLVYAQPPNLWFVEIKNDKPGKRTLIDSTYALDGNVEHQPNSLTLHMDNWIYSSNSNMRYKLSAGNWIKDYTTPRGQWGLSSDNVGRLYYNSNALLLATDKIKPNALFSNKYLSFEENNLNIISDNQRVYPLQATAVNRGYQENVLDRNGMLIDATSACAPLYYRNGDFEDWNESVFVALPEINSIKRLKVVHEGFGSKVFYQDTLSEYVSSYDEGFRPVNIKTGPDGNIYIVDMHRGIIQHKAYMTSYLKDLIIERKLDEVHGQGRVLRLSPIKSSQQPLAYDIESYPISNLFSENAFLRDRAQQHIISKNLKSYEKRLRKEMIMNEFEVNKLHALWTLEGLGLLTEDDLFRVILNSDMHLRFHAMDILSNLEIENLEKLNEVVSRLMLKKDEETDYLLSCHIGSLDVLDNQETYDFYKACLLRRDTSRIFIEAIVADSPGKEEYFFEKLSQENDSIFVIWKSQLQQILYRKKNNNPVHYYQERLKLEDRRTIGMGLYLQNCATCHGVEGEGKKQIAPPLVNSSIVSGKDEKLILITLHGLVGPFNMNGKVYDGYAGMPGIVHNDELDDQDIKDILHYVRNAFASADYTITEDKVCHLRAFPSTSGGAYTEDELSSMLKHIESLGILEED